MTREAQEIVEQLAQHVRAEGKVRAIASVVRFIEAAQENARIIEMTLAHGGPTRLDAEKALSNWNTALKALRDAAGHSSK